MTGFAKLISYVFQPLLMPTLVFYTLLFHLENTSNLTEKGRWTVVGLIFFTTCLIPMITVIMFRLTKVIADLQMTNRKDRFIPFIFVTIFYIVVAFLVVGQDWMNSVMSLVFITLTIVVVVTNLITFVWKISAHAAGVAGWLGFTIAFVHQYASTNTLFIPVLCALITCGLVFWARLFLNAHKPSELWAGALLGFSVCYGAISFFL